MTAPIPLHDTVLLIICPSCSYSGCARCNFKGRIPYDPYRHGGGEAGDDFHDLQRPGRVAEAAVSETAHAGSNPAAAAALTPLEQALFNACESVVDAEQFNAARAGRELAEAGHG